jgi:hypothetical protein
MRRLSIHEVPVLLVIVMLSCPGLLLRSQTKSVLPQVTSYALDKSKVTLPADLQGPQNLLILYFEPDQSDDALTWAKQLDQVRSAYPALASYILPVYPRENFLFRWWIEASIRSGAPAWQDQHTTIPIFIDKPNFLRDVGISGEKETALLLVDKTGNVEWKTQGKVESGKLSDLAAVLRSDSRSIVANHAVMTPSRFVAPTPHH